MPSSSSNAGTTASVVIAILGILFFAKKVVRAKTLGGPSTSSSRSGRGGGGAGGSERTAFAVGLLDIAIPRDDRPGGSFPRMMRNDACIARAVQEVSRKLVVSLRDAESMPAGAVRAYVSELYQEIYDAACAARRPDLDVRILLPAAGTSGGGGGGSSSGSGSYPFSVNASPDTTAAAAAPGTKWATREVAELEPDLEVLYSDEPQDGGRRAALNDNRIQAGFPPLNVVSLESVAKRAHNAEYFYAEDVLANIPMFSSVACGGTFDRLHGGHKKLLTFAASMCSDGILTVGVTSDSMLKTKSNAHMVTSLPERLEGVKDFVRTLNPQLQIRVEEITDPFGPPIVEEAFDAIVVSSETVLGAEKINEMRAQKGFRPLAVAVTRRMAASTLSSSYLRRAAEKQRQQKKKSRVGKSKSKKAA